ncbi:hypothetical protein JCM10449v2_000286 [Rhodotorula kratochvilovae]
MFSNPTVYFISGASRGIGLALTTIFAKRPDTLVFAGARTPEKADALNALAKETQGRVVVVKLDALSDEDHAAAAQLVKEKAGKVDIVIANAGIAEGIAPIAEATPSAFLRHYETNALGPLRLFQALAPLLAAAPAPQFVGVSSLLGSIAGMIPFPSAHYGASKATLNFILAKIAVEHGEKDNLAAYAIHPGLVASDMGKEGIKIMKSLGIDEFPAISPEESAAGIVKVVDGATREKTGGKFLQYTGEEYPW